MRALADASTVLHSDDERDPALEPARLTAGSRLENPRILLAATLRWPLAARLAIAFARLGCPVQAWCPPGHPLEKTRAVGRIHYHGTLALLESLAAAIHEAAPDLVVPCDDDAAILLHQLHEVSYGTAALAMARRVIERSLGTPASCSLATARAELMRLAMTEAIRVPASARLSGPADLAEWSAHSGFPAVLKSDHSWGGQGVAVVRDDEEALAAFHLATHPTWKRALAHLILRRDPSHVLRRFGGARPAVTVQKFIAGRPANRAVACWQGEVLAGISVVALHTQGDTGPATVVQVIDNEEMAESARRMVRALGLSGFCGLDFIIEAGTGDAYLIEVNPRATPISYLALGAGQDLIAALQTRFRGRPAQKVEAIRGDVIAMFPGEWRRDPTSPYLQSAFHDVPWVEMDLVRDCVDLPWEDRGTAARLRARLYPRRACAVRALPSPGLHSGSGSSSYADPEQRS